MAEEPKQKSRPASINALRLQDILKIGLHKWPWILVSVIVCLGLATLYLMLTAPTYTREAAIRIKDDTKGNSISSDLDGFSDLGLFQSNTNVIDEISSLESSNFMKEVVRRLNLTFSYSKEGKFHDEVAYGSTLPVTVIDESNDTGVEGSFRLHVSPTGEVMISDVVADEQEYPDRSYTGQLGGKLRTPLGTLLVLPSQYYAKGETVDLLVSKSTLKAAVDAYKLKLNVSLKNDKGNVIRLVCTDQSVQRAEDILNALIAVYNENWISDKNQIAVSTSNFINERLNVIEAELGNVDRDISSYKSEHLIPDINQASSLYMEQSKNTSDQLIALGAQLQMARYIREFLTGRAGEDQALPVNIGIDDAGIVTQVNTYNTMLLKRNSLMANSSVNNPAIRDLDSQLQTLRNAIITSIDNNIVSLRTSIANLERSDRLTTERIAANPTQARYLLSVERQQKVKESLYLFLLQKREENELSQAFTAYNTSIIDNPDGSVKPTSPKKRNVYTMALLTGLLIPFVVIYIRETNNTKIRGRKDLEGLSVPFIGEIPFDRPEKRQEANRLVVTEGNRGVINEAFRVLRTNLDFMTRSQTGQSVIMVTSFNPSSGKSFITMNLAKALALKNKRVLVIDGDIRKATASAYVGSPRHGLTDLLNGSADDASALTVCGTIHEGLCVLPVGKIPPNPTELLENGRLHTLLDELRKEYDYIFIDCPPVEMMADAQILSTEADRTLFVVRAGLLERSMIAELDKMYDEKKYRNMGVILNGTTSSNGRYGYGYGYGYGKGYGYGDTEGKKQFYRKAER